MIRQLVRLLVLLALLIPVFGRIERVPSVFAAGISYYVDCAAEKAGMGTEAAPFHNLAAINTVHLTPGDSVLFKRGSICSGTFAPVGSGSFAAPVTIAAYGPGLARPVINANGQTDAILLRNLQYIELSDLELTASGDNKTARRGVHVLGENAGDLYGITLRNLYIHDVRGYMPSTVSGNYHGTGKYANASGGIVIEVLGTAVPTAFHQVQVLNNQIASVDRQGIYVWSNYCQRPGLVEFWGSLCNGSWKPMTDLYISGNTLSDIGGDGIAPMTVDGALVESNTLTGFNMRSDSPNAGMWTANANNVTFQFNDTSGGKTTKDGMAYDIDHSTSNITFQYNYSHGNEGGFFLICAQGNSKAVNFVIRYNISVNDRARMFQSCGGEVVSSHIYNNTMYIGSGLAPVIYQETTNQRQAIQFRNNLIYKEGGGQVTWTLDDLNFVIDNNAFFGVPVPAWATNTVTTDPWLNGPGSLDQAGYKLGAGSVALNVGAVIPANGGRDYFGNAVSSTTAPSIGAYQGPGLAPAFVSPLAHFKLDDGSGVTAADAAGTNNGSLIGNPVWNNNGKIGGSLKLNGRGDYVSVPAVLNPGSGNFTVAGWVKLDTAAGVNQVIFQQEGVLGRTLLYRVTSTGQLGTFLGGSALLSSETIPTGEWTHVAVVNRGGAVTLYVNGQPVGSATRTIESQTSPFRIGAHKSPTDANDYWNGSVDDFQLYNTALNSAQVYRLYNS
ncbi:MULTISPECIES: LamG-like jellyroll fold domain-containing protein [unclassified Paenibacillus]|uniref:LamG-like jellyroll fold domain-containing protein n=1 Tax=unclassified Paenibacillus TaxID=185978 RepID=UPI0036892F1C